MYFTVRMAGHYIEDTNNIHDRGNTIVQQYYFLTHIYIYIHTEYDKEFECVKKFDLAFEYLKQEKEWWNIYHFDVQFLKKIIHHDSAHNFCLHSIWYTCIGHSETYILNVSGTSPLFLAGLNFLKLEWKCFARQDFWKSLSPFKKRR